MFASASAYYRYREVSKSKHFRNMVQRALALLILVITWSNRQKDVDAVLPYVNNYMKIKLSTLRAGDSGRRWLFPFEVINDFSAFFVKIFSPEHSSY